MLLPAREKILYSLKKCEFAAICLAIHWFFSAFLVSWIFPRI